MNYFAAVKEGYICIYVGNFDTMDLTVWADSHAHATLGLYFTNNKIQNITCSSSVDYPEESGCTNNTDVGQMIADTLYVPNERIH